MPDIGLGLLWYKPRKFERVDYEVSQSNELPKSVLCLEAPGDGRCIAALTVLVYVIPLQLKVCLLVAGYMKGWPPNEELVHLHNSFQLHGPSDTISRAEEVIPFAVANISKRLEQKIVQRVDQLERELAAK
jgi:hypothetical protein